MLKTIEFILGKQNNAEPDAPPEEIAELRKWQAEEGSPFAIRIVFADPDEELPERLTEGPAERGIPDGGRTAPASESTSESRSEPKTGPETESASEPASESGTGPESETGPESKTGSDPGCLAVTDDPRIYRKLKAEGIPAGVYSHRGNRGRTFSGAEYLIEEPARVDEDSWEKIYERLYRLPWTILETPRCIVREFVPEDLEPLYGLYDAQARRFILPPGEDREEEQRILNAYIGWVYSFYGFGYWAVVRKETDRLIGRFGYAVLSEGTVQADTGADVSFGYLLAKEARGEGLAREVCAALLGYGFEMLGFQKILAEADADNVISETLLKQLGFTWAGVYRQDEEGPTFGDRMNLFLLEKNSLKK